MELLIKTAEGKFSKVTDAAMKTIHSSLNENSAEEIGAKLLIATCLYGIGSEETQRLLKKRFYINRKLK